MFCANNSLFLDSRFQLVSLAEFVLQELAVRRSDLLLALGAL